MDLDNDGDTSISSLFKAIWTDFYKKVNFLLLKIGHNAINTNDKIQRRCRHIALSPQCCHSASGTMEQLTIFSFISNLLSFSGWKSSLPLVCQPLSHVTSKTFLHICSMSPLQQTDVEHPPFLIFLEVL